MRIGPVTNEFVNVVRRYLDYALTLRCESQAFSSRNGPILIAILSCGQRGLMKPLLGHEEQITTVRPPKRGARSVTGMVQRDK